VKKCFFFFFFFGGKKNKVVIIFFFILITQQKEDVHWSIIGDLQEKDSESRQRLAVYCLKDAVLPFRLMNKLKIIVWEEEKRKRMNE
jgi:hypothetical protein